MAALAAKVGIDRGNLHKKLHKSEHGFDVEQVQDVADVLGCPIVWHPKKARRRTRAQ